MRIRVCPSCLGGLVPRTPEVSGAFDRWGRLQNNSRDGLPVLSGSLFWRLISLFLSLSLKFCLFENLLMGTFGSEIFICLLFTVFTAHCPQGPGLGRSQTWSQEFLSLPRRFKGQHTCPILHCLPSSQQEAGLEVKHSEHELASTWDANIVGSSSTPFSTVQALITQCSTHCPYLGPLGAPPEPSRYQNHDLVFPGLWAKWSVFLKVKLVSGTSLIVRERTNKRPVIIYRLKVNE